MGCTSSKYSIVTTGAFSSESQEIVNRAIEVFPDTKNLQFVLNPAQRISTCVLTLKHPGTTKSHIAFKVQTTHRHRYFVRPNQGIVAPNSTQSVTILLVEEDRQFLLQSFDLLGQAALDHSKDKFLVQSCSVNDDFAKAYKRKSKMGKMMEGDGRETNTILRELKELLQELWNSASSGEDVSIFNKKLRVRHAVVKGAGNGGNATREGAMGRDGAGPSGVQPAIEPSLDSMNPEQMFAEITSLRRKNDELVTFSVNLTAERDILNNTLAKTKRDLKREIARSRKNKVGSEI